MTSTPDHVSSSSHGHVPNSAAAAVDSRGDLKLHHLKVELEHARGADGNRRALLAEKLDALHGLTKKLQQNDWMYAGKSADPFSGGGQAAAATCLAACTLTASDPDEL